MSEFCILCGEALVEGKCPNAAQHFKPMCLNCNCVKRNEEGEYRCFNETNMENARQKLLANVGDFGYEIALTPRALKDPTKKCKLWNMNEEEIMSTIKTL